MTWLFVVVLGCYESRSYNDLNTDLDSDGYSQFDLDCDDNNPNLLSYTGA